METNSKDDRAARKERLREARSLREKEARKDEWEGTLGKALMDSLMRHLGTCAPERAEPVKRAISMIGYGDDLKRLIVRCIETNPAMDESFLLIAELAFRDGANSVEPSYEDYH